MNLEELAHENMKTHLVDHPCRGIVLGRRGNDGIEISWIMGRSPNSQNRIYVLEGGKKDRILKTEPADASKVEDPRLIIYTAMRSKNCTHIVSNGDQTDNILDWNEHVGIYEFFQALEHHYCEPDPSNFTARISGCQIVDHQQMDEVYLSVLKAEPFAKELWIKTVKESGLTVENFKSANRNAREAMDAFNGEIGKRCGLNYKEFPTLHDRFGRHVEPGFGYMLTTYMPGSKELPPFSGEPLLVPIRGTLEEAMQYFWNALEPEWRVSLGGREITEKGVRYATPINKFDKVV